MESLQGWRDIPEPILVMVLKHISVRDVFSVGLVCHRWNDISNDDLLWKWLLRRDFKLKFAKTLTLKPNATSWQEEYKRLVDRCPAVKVQSLTGHTDEVLHVTFSHDSNEIVSCSKDHHIIVWRREEDGIHFREHHREDMSEFSWVHTWAAQFSPSDICLMVAGVVDRIEGEIAIFLTGRMDRTGYYILMCRVVNDPYDVLGCWCTDNFFISGTIANQDQHLDAQLFLCTPLLARNLDVITVQSYKRLLFKYRSVNPMGTINVRFVQNHSRRQFKEVEWPVNRDNILQIAPMPISDELPESEKSQVLDDELCLMFLCGNKTKVPHQLGFQRITEESLRRTTCLIGPERVIDFNGHIVGMATSPCGNYLYVNIRTWAENAVPTQEQAPAISNQIELQVVDLSTLTKVGRPLVGHQGFTPSEKAFYLYVDVGQDLVASGSEDAQGYIWDRHYGALVSRLRHDSCVNSIVLCPQDEEICVTASDDHTLSVWISPNLNRKLPALP